MPNDIRAYPDQAYEVHRRLIESPVAGPMSLKRRGVDRDARVDVGAFSQGQQWYLELHRENVLRMARGLPRDKTVP